MTFRFHGLTLWVLVLSAAPAMAGPLTDGQRQHLRKMQEACDYRAIARAYADYMIEHGRDTYGKVHSPLFMTVLNRKTGKPFKAPYPHVKTKPYAPGLRRDHKMRPYDRTYVGSNPLQDLPLYELLYRLSELTGDRRYGEEADKSIAWFLDHAQAGSGLFPWGSHMYYHVGKDKGVYSAGRYGGHEYNFVWPYWDQNPEALKRFAHGIWKHHVKDHETGHFNRHSDGRKGGMEFPQTGSCYMDIWAREYGRSGDPEMKKHIQTLLALYRSMRDPETGAMAWCTKQGPDRREVATPLHNLDMASNLQDAAAHVEERDPALAEEMRTFVRFIDDEYLSNDYDKVLDVAGKGILTWYTVADRRPMAKGFTLPPKGVDASIGYPLRTTDGKPAASLYYLAPWFPGRSYAEFSMLLWRRYEHCEEKHKPTYRRALLDIADIYMSIGPEVQFAQYPDNIADVVALLRYCHKMTGNIAYLHRADQMMHLGVKLFFDETSPLPKISNFDPWYESSLKNESSVAILREMVELDRDLQALPAGRRRTPAVAAANRLPPTSPATGENRVKTFRADFRAAAREGLAGAWNLSGLHRPSRDVTLEYGPPEDARRLYLSLEQGTFGGKALSAGAFDLRLSDVINKIPTTKEADRVNDGRMRRFTGKGMTRSNLNYAGFKDVAAACGLVLRNASADERRVELTTTFHDTYHDNGKQTLARTLGPDERRLLVVRAPDRRYIRRIRLRSEVEDAAVTVESFAFIMAPRSAMNPPQ